jgi:hypothetical protein
MTDYKTLYNECRSRREQDRERIAGLEAQLEQANARTEACLADVPGRWELARKLEQAEAREDAWMGEEQIQRTRAEQAEAEVEWLKCCGNCGNFESHPDYVGVCWDGRDERPNDSSFLPSDHKYIEGHDRCVFTPSRWTARAEEGSRDE